MKTKKPFIIKPVVGTSTMRITGGQFIYSIAKNQLLVAEFGPDRHCERAFYLHPDVLTMMIVNNLDRYPEFAENELPPEDIAMLDELSYQTTMRAKSKRWLKRLLVSLLVAVGLAERPVSPEYEAAMQASKRIRPARPEQYEGGTHDGE